MWNAWFDRGGLFAEIDALSREMEEAFRRPAPEGPRFELREDANGYTLTADLPGVPSDAVIIEVQGDTLTLKAERKEEAPKGYELRARERGSYRVARSLSLPENVDVASITARMEHGRLTLGLPRRPVQEPRRITVNA